MTAIKVTSMLQKHEAFSVKGEAVWAYHDPLTTRALGTSGFPCFDIWILIFLIMTKSIYHYFKKEGR